MRLLSCRQVADLTSLSVSHIRRLSREGKFPEPITVSESRVAWTDEAITIWIQSKLGETKNG
jgi:prophage regulatory protein